LAIAAKVMGRRVPLFSMFILSDVCKKRSCEGLDFRMLVKDDRVKESASTSLYWCKDVRGLSNQNVTVRFCELVCDCGP
jgi:hypothetical protein